MADQKSREAELENVLGARSSDNPKRFWMRPLLWLGLVLGGAVLALAILSAGDSGRDFKYSAIPVTRGDLLISVTATGTVEPTNVVEVSSELSGILHNVLVEHNDQVSAGQTLATLNTDKLSAQVRRSRATLVAAQAKVREVEATVAEQRRALKRTQSLVSKQVTSQQTLDTAEAAFERALAALASARANISIATADLDLNETNLSKAHISSPINGIVLKRNAEPGQIVASSLQAPILFLVAEDLKKMELRVDIDEADIGSVGVGANAQFMVEAYQDRTFEAQISKLHLAPEKVEGVVTYKAILTVDNSTLALRPGMTATAEITIEEMNDVLLIPNAALRFQIPSSQAKSGSVVSGFLNSLRRRKPKKTKTSSPPNGDREVLVLRQGKPVSVKIKTGATDGRHTQVLGGGLTLDDRIVIALIGNN